MKNDSVAPVANAELAGKAAVLVEALPYLKKFHDATVVIKYGGAAMIDPNLRRSFARDITLLIHLGLHPIIVHGGGPELTRMLDRLGIETGFVDGHRVTDAASAEIAQMVLAGSVNKELVAHFVAAGAKAVGLCGADAGLLTVTKHTPNGADIGFVGVPQRVDTKLLKMLASNGFLPVVSPTTVGADGHIYNVNADLVAAAIAAALPAEKLIYLSDVPGLLRKGDVVHRISSADVRAMLDSGEASGGMRPKLTAALDALGAGVSRVHLIDGRVEHAVLLEVFTDHGVGTLITTSTPHTEDARP